MRISDVTGPSVPGGPVRKSDVLLAVAVAAGSVLLVFLLVLVVPEQSGFRFSQEQLQLTALMFALQGLALVLWNARPVLCLVLVVTLVLMLWAVSPGDLATTGASLALICYRIGTRLQLSRALVLVSAAAIVLMAAWTLKLSTLGQDIWTSLLKAALQAFINSLLPLVGGIVVATRAQNRLLVLEHTRREHEQQLELALIQERRRIARELHDVAAHHLAGIVVQASAVGVLIDKEPAAAKEAAAQLRSQSKETLEGLRSVVGMLREDEDTSPVAGLNDLPALVESTRELGVQVELLQPLTLPRLAPVVDATVYRVAQQALSNALQHAPGSAVQIEVITIGDYPRLEIVNSPAPRRALTTPAHTNTQFSGTGLAAMRERATLIGARFDAGPTTEGGWRVCLDLPMPAMTRGEA